MAVMTWIQNSNLLPMKTRITISALLLILCLEGMNAFGWQGSGTSADPYQIATAADLATLATIVNNGNQYIGTYFRLMNDISLAGYAWAPIGWVSPFGGKFNGNNKTISGLSCSGYTSAGLFGVVTTHATITHLNILDCNITGDYYAGGLAAFLDGGSIIIHNCHVSGTISAPYAGGLIGEVNNTSNPNSGSIVYLRYCSSSATINGDGRVGGLIGNVEGSCSFNGQIKPMIMNCYSTGPVNGVQASFIGGLIGFLGCAIVQDCFSRSTVTAGAVNNEVGGLVGYASLSTFTRSFSTGFVSPGTGRGFIGQSPTGGVTNCFWDTQTSGQSSSNGGGTGKTTAEMKNPATFTNYDFSQNWALSDTVNNGYPYLSPLFVWVGNISTDWSNANNWDYKAVPPPGATVSNSGGNTQTNYNAVIGQGASSPVRLVNLQLFTSPPYVGGQITITSGKALTVQGKTTLGSGEKLIIETEGSFIDNGITGTGYATVKHDLSGNRWWYIGSPTNATAGSFGTLSPTPNTGTRLFYWNEPTNAYINITDGSAALVPLKGYSYKNFTGAYTAIFTGNLNSGWMGSDNNLSFTPGGANAGYNLVCNPFPSAIRCLDTKSSAAVTLSLSPRPKFRAYRMPHAALSASSGE